MFPLSYIASALPVVLVLSTLRSVTAVPRPLLARDVPNGQVRRRGCGVHINEARVESAERKFQSMRIPEDTDDSKATLNVYFHIIHANETVEGGYISEQTIFDQVSVLNHDYSNTGLSFNLVNISRVHNQTWFLKVTPESDYERVMKETYRQGGPADLNVYTVGFVEGEGKGVLGYATFPMDYEEKPLEDGVVLLFSTVPGGSNVPFNKGRTLTHEVGHWMGLYHTFQGGCQGAGDEVDDTPPEEDAAYGCPEKRDTCSAPGVDAVTNFMNYVDDNCMNAFTPGQIKRIRAQMRTYRDVEI